MIRKRKAQTRTFVLIMAHDLYWSSEQSKKHSKKEIMNINSVTTIPISKYQHF